MWTKKKIQKEALKLEAWFLENSRPLPWRKSKNPYRIWISEIMLQQTTVKAVIPFFNRYGFLSAKKKRDFAKFKEIAILIQDGEHLNEIGIKKILAIRNSMNDGGAGRRKYSDVEILQEFSSGKSSETTRQA